MKKLILSTAILLGSLSAFTANAQDENSAQPATENAVSTPAETSYTEVKLEEVPAPINEAFKKSFPDAKMTKAFINEKKEYKLEVEVGDKVGSLYADASGKWIQ